MEVVADRDILARLDRHMERGTELMEANREAFERNREAFERTRDALDRHDDALQDLRIFIRDMVHRNERVWREVAAELKDLRDERRAQLRGLFAVIDRLEGGQAGA
jgi:hypothetical protein